ncbi:limonene-1,2-epoxide hydrolase family protein [Tomitella biformata]|uniref:limonene-1,2-epoxide hydrolase family protein n=1 Tax=Tomitella biformata TaxID=630403 RepID=UPI000467DEBB|nr:limonene-1,2-epoxide hydrolase family protein [Tomitella biformata]
MNTPQNNGSHTGPDTDTSPLRVVARYLDALNDGRLEEAMALVAKDIVYTNVSLPTIHGRRRVAKLLSLFNHDWLDFGVVTHRIAENGTAVLTERHDALTLGPLRFQFWVCGTFEVVDGQIVLWRDYFDYFNMVKASGRAIAGAVIPALRPRFPDR